MDSFIDHWNFNICARDCHHMGGVVDSTIIKPFVARPKSNLLCVNAYVSLVNIMHQCYGNWCVNDSCWSQSQFNYSKIDNVDHVRKLACKHCPFQGWVYNNISNDGNHKNVNLWCWLLVWPIQREAVPCLDTKNITGMNQRRNCFECHPKNLYHEDNRSNSLFLEAYIIATKGSCWFNGIRIAHVDWTPGPMTF